MAFIAGKLAFLLLRPSNLLLVLALAGVAGVALRRRWGVRLLVVAVLLMTVCTLLPVGLWLSMPLEDRFHGPEGDAGRVDGIVVEGVGAGNMNPPFYHAVCDALAAGIPVVIGSRHLSGQPYPSKGYLGSLKSVIERGAIRGGFLSGVKARILLMVALAHTSDREGLRAIFARAAAPVRGL